MNGPEKEENTSPEDAEFQQFWESDKERLFRFIRVFFPDYQEAEDVLQETGATLARDFKHFIRNRSFYSWAKVFAWHKVQHALRKKQNHPWILECDLEEELSEIVAAPEPQSDDRILAMREGLSELKGQDRKFLELHYIEGMTLQEISTQFSVPERTVRFHLAQARAWLCQYIETKLRNQP
jgi:RNA polymerase sigma factor (sigma-70 family)